ncbi:MAG: polyketide synthase, partial [Marmoricola sp.]
MTSPLTRLASSHGASAVAVVGIGCRFPGATGPQQLWELMMQGRDVISEVPRSRFDVDKVYSPEPAVPGRISSRWGGFIDGVDLFDASFFGISPREALRMDPQQRMLLETSYAACEDAGLTLDMLAGSRSGVFIGQVASNYWDLQSREGILDIYSTVGSAARSVLSGRISYAFDLRGPSLSVDTACSSSLVAVHLAMSSLRSGEADLALAGG